MAVSHKLYRPIVNTPNKVSRESTQNKTPTATFHISDYLRYTNEGYNYMVYLVDISTDDPGRINYRIKLLRGNIMMVTKEFLKSKNMLDIGLITISSEDYINELKNITYFFLKLCFHKCYHLYTRSSNTGMKMYPTSILNP